MDIDDFQPQKDIHILVVDPFPYSRKSLEETLRFCNYQVTVAEDVMKALKLLAKGKYKFNIAMIDVHKDEADGFNFIMLATNMKIFTIYISAVRDGVLTKEARSNGANMFMLKPVELETAKHLWQHVFPRNIKIKEDDQSREKYENGTSPNESGNEKEMSMEEKYGYNNMELDINEHLPNKKRKC